MATCPGQVLCVCVCRARGWGHGGTRLAALRQKQLGRSRSARGADLMRRLCRLLGGAGEEPVVALVIVGTRDEDGVVRAQL